MKTNEQLAEIYQDALNAEGVKRMPYYQPEQTWSALAESERNVSVAAMQAAVSALLESVPLDVTLEDCHKAWADGSTGKGATEGWKAVADLCRSSMLKRLTLVMALPEKWKDYIYGDLFTKDLHEALATLSQPSAEVAPVPEINAEWKGEAGDRLSKLLDDEEVAPVPEIKLDRWAAEKAAHAKGIKIECRSRYAGDWSIWEECPAPEWHDNKDVEYRADPSGHLSREHLMKLCGGKEPHRWDWKTEDLPEGMRPLAMGEPYQKGDEVNVLMGWGNDVDAGFPMSSRHLLTRTRRPAPQAPGQPAPEIKADMGENPQTEPELWDASHTSALAKSLYAERGRVKDLKAERDELTRLMVQEQAAKHEALSRISALSPRPVTQKPTKEEMDRDGNVVLIDKNNHAHICFGTDWQDIHESWVCWLPLNLAAYGLAETPEDKERREFEAWWEARCKDVASHKTDLKSAMFDVWQARAGKEAA